MYLRFDFSRGVHFIEKQLKRINVSDNFLQGNQKVMTSPVGLSNSRQLEGIRTVFGEMVPVPIRIISIGISIDKLIVDIASSDRWSYTVDLCHCTHASRASEIKELLFSRNWML